MMIGQIDIPQPLLEAQRNGTLVVFAGAGVSMPPPSNYPDFAQLALQIAGGGSAFTPEDDEPQDRFLGRLESQGVQVHRRARNLLRDPNSRPNRLHCDLLSLFTVNSSVRLVTTNFDSHFTAAAAEMFEREVALFNAPALPLGNRFEGIVYLHGSVERDAQELVLTDGDFGRAYLTEGWARRFLQAMFDRYTVLFVGYSHSDVVTSYLARGLPPDARGQRYALIKGDEDQRRWDLLGVSPITYPPTEEPDSHRALGESLGRWVEIARMGALDHEQKIMQLVQAPPPLVPEDADYIHDALGEPVKARFFSQHARGQEWLRWADGKQAFEEMFEATRPGRETDGILARWFAEHFACEHPEESLGMVRSRGSQLNPVLWEAVVDALAYKMGGDPGPDAQTVARWVAVLLRSQYPDDPSHLLTFLLDRCRRPDDNLTIVLLFEHLTGPRAELARSLFPQGGRVRQEIGIAGDTDLLREIWGTHFRPNLAVFAELLQPILVGHLQRAHLLLRSTGEAAGYWDPLTAWRTAIEPHEQDLRDTGVDLLVDAARDTLEWTLEHRPEHARRMIELLSAYDFPLLKRLAVHGVTEDSAMSADEKMEWLLQKDLLYAYGLKHEVFRLLADAYPNASETSQRRVLNCVLLGHQGEDAQGLEERTRQYEIYNLLYWLHRAAPDSAPTTERFEDMQQAHQGEFEPREHPDLSSYVTGLMATESPITVEALLDADVAERLDWLLTYQGDRADRITRNGLLGAVGEAVARSYPYGRALSEALRERGAWDTDLWSAVLRGWREEGLAEDQWDGVLGFLTEHPELYAFAHEVSNLLEDGARENRDGSIPMDRLPPAETLAERVWATLDDPQADAGSNSNEGWLFEAINHPGGKLTEFWLLALSRRRAEAGENWDGMPEDYRRYLGGVLSGSSHAADLGRVLLASQLFFLFSTDAEWTRQNVLPLLDWSADARRAEQTWHGYLSWGRWSEALLPDLMPLYEETFAHVRELPQGLQRQFTKHLASIAVYGPGNPVEEGWLDRFLHAVEPENRSNWASDVGSILRELEEDAIRDLWARWIEGYWARRNTAVPSPLEAAEFEGMVDWSLRLDPFFPEAVQLILEGTPPVIGHSRHFYRRLAQSGYASRYPEAVAKLIRHLLPHDVRPFLHCTQIAAVFPQLARSIGSQHPMLFQICDELARLGCHDAAQLRRLIA